MLSPSIRRHAAVLLAVPLLAACGASGGSAPVAGDPGVASAPLPQTAPATAMPNTSGAFNPLNPQATPATASSATSAAAAAPAGALVFQITPGQSKATFRVREQLAGRDLPNDAVGSTSSVTGQLAIRPDGTLGSDASKIAVDLNSLATDQSMRDQFIKFNTLQTRQFATAEFVPTKVEGLPTPLPASGQYSFKLTGLMTIHGVQKELTWDVTAQRDGANVTGTATSEFKFGDFGMTPPKAPAVLSVVDDIRLEVSLAATQAS